MASEKQPTTNQLDQLHVDRVDITAFNAEGTMIPIEGQTALDSAPLLGGLGTLSIDHLEVTVNDGAGNSMHLLKPMPEGTITPAEESWVQLEGIEDDSSWTAFADNGWHISKGENISGDAGALNFEEVKVTLSNDGNQLIKMNMPEQNLNSLEQLNSLHFEEIKVTVHNNDGKSASITAPLAGPNISVADSDWTLTEQGQYTPPQESIIDGGDLPDGAAPEHGEKIIDVVDLPNGIAADKQEEAIIDGGDLPDGAAPEHGEDIIDVGDLPDGVAAPEIDAVESPANTALGETDIIIKSDDLLVKTGDISANASSSETLISLETLINHAGYVKIDGVSQEHCNSYWDGCNEIWQGQPDEDGSAFMHISEFADDHNPLDIPEGAEISDTVYVDTASTDFSTISQAEDANPQPLHAIINSKGAFIPMHSEGQEAVIVTPIGIAPGSEGFTANMGLPDGWHDDWDTVHAQEPAGHMLTSAPGITLEIDGNHYPIEHFFNDDCPEGLKGQPCSPLGQNAPESFLDETCVNTICQQLPDIFISNHDTSDNGLLHVGGHFFGENTTKHDVITDTNWQTYHVSDHGGMDGVISSATEFVAPDGPQTPAETEMNCTSDTSIDFSLGVDSFAFAGISNSIDQAYHNDHEMAMNEGLETDIDEQILATTEAEFGEALEQTGLQPEDLAQHDYDVLV